MESLTYSISLLALLFFVVSFAYSSVGLGGGSSYTALMAIVGLNYVAIPTVSLTLNLFVSSIGTYNFTRKKHAKVKLILPFIATSIPFSYFGGSLSVSKDIFQITLLASLLFVVVRIYFFKKMEFNLSIGRRGKLFLSMLIGALLGLVAGIVGIGGGVYLVPLIIIFRLGSEKEAAASASYFVFVNSLSGLFARINHNPINIMEFVPLIIAVIIGGSLGSFLGSTKLTPAAMQKILGIIIVAATLMLTGKMVA